MEKLQLLLSLTVVYQYNMKILHWKSAGKDFDAIHSMAQSYYTEMDTHMDELAEMCMMNGLNPVSLQSALVGLGEAPTNYIVLDCAETFDAEKCFEIITILFSHIMDAYEEAIPDVSADSRGRLDEFRYWYRKELEYKLKLRRG